MSSVHTVIMLGTLINKLTLFELSNLDKLKRLTESQLSEIFEEWLIYVASYSQPF